MPKMTKSEVRKRLSEAGMKLGRIYVYGESHLTDNQYKKIIDMRLQILKIVNQLK